MDSDQENLSLPVRQDARDAALPVHRELSEQEKEHYRGLIEAVIFLATEPISLSLVCKQCNLDRVNAREAVDFLIDDYEARNGGLLLKEIAGGYQFITSERYSIEMKNICKEKKRISLSRAALETLSIICYQEPITLPEIEDIRGASSRAMIGVLLQHKLIKPQGMRLTPGRPSLYVTTQKFLSHFSLGSLQDLPSLREVKELEFDEID